MNKDILIQIQDILKKNNWTITTAESCTGGLVASMITSISGSSAIFNGAIITYSNDVKEKELGVLKQTILKYGVVSKEVVSQMLDGVMQKFNASFAIAISGIAGPDGGTKNKPVGTVVIGIKDFLGNKDIEIYHFQGNRNTIQHKSAITSLEKMLKILKKLSKTLDK
jgi:nicotinamide-nucleotide amidase